MIIVKVSYTVQSAFVQQNQENIKLFMDDFKKLNSNEFRYASYLSEDGKTFIHISHFQNRRIQNAVLQTPSFVFFQKQRDGSDLEHLPKIESIELVASSEPIFNN